jgi:transcriptional regulator with XRE-family HTH domain
MPVERIHRSKQPHRPHFIPEWAERRGLRQTDIVDEIGADKSLVSRWFGGATPTEDYQEKLGELFGCGREGIFRHPDDDWLTQFFRNRSIEDVKKAKNMLEAVFGAPDAPKKARK